MFHSYLQNGIWLVGSVTVFVIAARLLHRHSFRRTPFFIVYLMAVGLQEAANFVAMRVSPEAWFYSYLAGSAITILLSYFVLFELVRNMFESGAIRLERHSYIAVVAVACAISLAVAVNLPMNEPSAILRARLLTEEVLRLAQLQILAIYCISAVWFGLTWRTLEFGIVCGYGFYAANALVVTFVRMFWGRAAQHDFSLGQSMAYFISVVIWTVYAFLPEPEPKVEQPRLGEVLAHVRHWRRSIS